MTTGDGGGGEATAPQDVPDWAGEPGPPYRGLVAIEWPAPVGGSVYACLLGRGARVTDAVTGKPLAYTGLTVHADAAGLITADLTMAATDSGLPLLEGDPVPDGEEIWTGTFPFVVSEMRVRKR